MKFDVEKLLNIFLTLYGCYTGSIFKKYTRNLSMRPILLGVIFRTRMEERNDLFPLNLERDILSTDSAHYMEILNH